MDVPVTTKVRCAWKKFRELARFLTDVQSVISEGDGPGSPQMPLGCRTSVGSTDLDSKREMTDEDDQLNV